MKRTALTIGSVLILILSAVVFVLVPALAGGLGEQGPHIELGSYAGHKIEFKAGSPFQTEYSRLIEQWQSWGYTMSEQLNYNAFMQAFNSTVQKMAVKEAVAKSGYIVTDKEVDQSLLPYYSDAKGVYSPELYKAASKSQRLSLRSYVEEELTTSRYVDDVFGIANEELPLYGVKLSSKEIDFYKAMGEEERVFDLASYALTDVPDEVTRDYAAKHGELFTKVDLSVISMEKEEGATMLLNRIKANELTFDDAILQSAKYYSGADGKCTAEYQYALKNIVTDSQKLQNILALGEGELSGVIQTSSGYSIFRCDTKAIPTDFTLEGALDIVSSYIRSFEMGLMESYYSDKAKAVAQSAAAIGFTAACNEAGLDVIQLPAFPLNYSDSPILNKIPSDKVSELQGAALSENFLREAFSLKEGEVGEPLVLNERMLLLHLKDITASADNAIAVSEAPAVADGGAEAEASGAIDDSGTAEGSKAKTSEELRSSVQQLNQQAAARVIMSSAKLVNNSQAAFFTYFTANAQEAR